jgi:hypothetical protein
MDQAALVRCLIGISDEQEKQAVARTLILEFGTEEEKQAVLGALARGAAMVGRGVLGGARGVGAGARALRATPRAAGGLVGGAAKATIPRAGRAVGAVAAPVVRGGARAAGAVGGGILRRLTGTGFGKAWKFSPGRTLMTGLFGIPIGLEAIAAGRKAAVTPHTYRPTAQYYARGTRMG